MNEFASGGVGKEDLGGHKRKEPPVGSVVGLRAPESPRSPFTSVTGVPLVRVPQEEKLRKTGRVDAEVFN